MTDQRSLSTQVWAELFLLGLIWGGRFLAIRLALNEVNVMTSVAHRVFWAALILWVYVALRRLPVPRDPKVWFALFVMGLLNNVIPYSLMAWGQLHIPTGLTSVFNAGTAIFGVVVAAAILTDERMTARKALGSAAGFLGVVTAIGFLSLPSFAITSPPHLRVVGAT